MEPGFIGSNFVPYFCEKYKDYHVINLDKLTYAGSLENLKECENLKNYTFVEGDICDEVLIPQLFEKYDIQGVVHFAAESHVDNSISGPGAFIKTNINGTFNLLENARKRGWNLQIYPNLGMKILDFTIYRLMKFMEPSEKWDCFLRKLLMHQTLHIPRVRQAQILL